MRLSEEPSVLTESFLNGITTAVNQSTMSAEQKLDVQSALVAELKSNSGSIQPRKFVQDHVPDGHQSEIAHLAEEQKTPMANFPKDASRVQSRIRRLRLDMSNDVHVIAPPEAVGEGKAVSVTQSGDGPDTVTITGGKLLGVKGDGSR